MGGCLDRATVWETEVREMRKKTRPEKGSSDKRDQLMQMRMRSDVQISDMMGIGVLTEVIPRVGVGCRDAVDRI